MRKIMAIIALGMLGYSCGGAKALLTANNTPVVATIDLVNVADDKVPVILNPGAFTTDEVRFYIPKTVPGTYSSDNYGKYIENFKAYYYNGNELSANKTDDNTWVIAQGKNLDWVKYEVNDTYDTENEVAEAVFSPAGTNIAKGKNFMLNLHGFVGYFEGLNEVPYSLIIDVPEGLSATTSLEKIDDPNGKPNQNYFKADRYFEVIDNPILYAKADTETFLINDITITLSVYSPNNLYTAASLKDRMEKMMGAQKSFLGAINSTKHYTILLYLSTLEETDATGFGALEHHTSTVVVLPEQMAKDRLEQAMVDVVSHEFFHIVTPLSVHSKEIQYFDFNDPEMSEHLWMYEGTTEYFANLFQIQQGLIDETEFYNRIMGKITNAKAYDDTMSFTKMSKNVLDEPYKDNYANVYEKGALINMALDITLRDLSNGEKSVLWLMKELSKKYGKTTPFNDDELLDEIVAMTYPEVRAFFNTHVVGETPIDYETFLSQVGLTKGSEEKESGYFLNGNIPFIDVDQANGNAIFIRKGIELNSFLNDLGIQGGDIIKSINGTAITLESIRPIIGQSFGWTPETEVKMVVERDGEELEIAGAVGKPMLRVATIKAAADATEKQMKLREVWMKG